jgi:hypothetical protein
MNIPSSDFLHPKVVLVVVVVEHPLPLRLVRLCYPPLPVGT